VLIELARTGKTREERKWCASHCDYGFIVKKGKPSDSSVVMPLFVYYKIFFFFWKIIFLKVNLWKVNNFVIFDIS
jgi:hypothetical protein